TRLQGDWSSDVCSSDLGDPAWFDVVNGMTLDGPDRLSGLREVLTADYGRGLDCDGVFLDTIDTAAPNSYTNAGSANQTEFEWTEIGRASCREGGERRVG